jgi:hypothetical protein
LRNTRVILTLHDINNHFAFKPAPDAKRWVRFIGKRALIKIVKEFNVISSTMVDYLKNKLPTTKKVHCIPGRVFDETRSETLPDDLINSIRIVIPGSIDQRRRNYEIVFDLLHQIDQKNLQISLVLLGGISEHGKEILDKCKLYVSRLANLKFFQTDVVDQPVFDREMELAHFVLIPSVIHTVIFDGISETYGLSMSSGTIFDAIKHAKPVIIPEQLAVPDNVESSCFKYATGADIIHFLESFFIRPEKYQEWSEKAVNNSKAYTIENLRRNNPSVFGEPRD